MSNSSSFDVKYQGVTFGSWNDDSFSSGFAQGSLDEIVDINANAVSVVATYTSDSLTAGGLYASSSTESLASIAATLEAAQARGLDVLLKPHVVIAGGGWSGDLKPTDVAGWFADYKAEILDLARLAEKYDVALFSIGNELNGLLDPANEPYWRDLIASVREVYSGDLTLSQQFYQLDQVQFWDALDVIGLNSYIRVSDALVPTVDQSTDAWTVAGAARSSSRPSDMSVVEYVQSLSEKWDKPVVMTELGFPSNEGAAAAPADFNPKGAVSYEAQDNMYQGFFDAWSGLGDWFQGAFFFGWNVARGQDNPYTPQGKTAFATIAEAFGDQDGHTANAITEDNLATVTVRVSSKVTTAGFVPELLVVLDGLVIGRVQVTALLTNNKEYQEFTFAAGDADPSKLQVYFANPKTNNTIYVDWVEVNGVRYQAEGYGVQNGAIPDGYAVTGIHQPLFTDGALSFDLKYGAADGQYAAHKGLSSGETWTGTAGADLATLYGTKNVISTGDGNDLIDGSRTTGTNRFDGGAGDDVIQGGAGSDTIITGAGQDRVMIVNDGSADTITDFDPLNDVLDFSFAKATTGSLSVAAATVGGVAGTLVTYMSTSVFLRGVAPLNLRPENFVFYHEGQLPASEPELPAGLFGSAGDDVFDLGDLVNEITDTGGNDTIVTTISRQLADFPGIENILLSGTGNIQATGDDGDNVLTGNAGDNVLNGRLGNDTLFGMGGSDKIYAGSGDDYIDGGAGQDELHGGAGNDTFVLGDGYDTVFGEGGRDTITSTISRDLHNYGDIVNLTLWGTANVNATGNGRDNIIIGNSGNNVLDGGNGGQDQLEGGLGDDTYVLRAGFDTVIDTGGNDTITSTISRDLRDYAGIENVTLLSSGNVNATGDDVANILIGNGAKNILEGGGGADILQGGLGNDTYVLGADTTDTLIDTGGNDTITSTISRSLAGYATIENLTLLGIANIDATGNALANVLTGNTGNNVLDGGAGKDTLNGGLGNDTYVLGSDTTDTIVDAGGNDTITSTITRSLAGYTTIENVTLLGTASINATGNGLANVLSGNGGSNVLDGGAGNDTLIGGLGRDTMTGGSGKDTFVFRTFADSGVGAGIRDVIKDFRVGDDRIDLSALGITKFDAAAGTLFSGVDNELRWFKQDLSGTANDVTIIEIDTNHDKVADMQIELRGLINLSQSDFII
jgi:Ca2+-binding RTX toxin-like protein